MFIKKIRNTYVWYFDETNDDNYISYNWNLIPIETALKYKWERFIVNGDLRKKFKKDMNTEDIKKIFIEDQSELSDWSTITKEELKQL